MITRIGKKGGRGGKVQATIVDIIYRSESSASGLTSPLSNITFANPYFRLTTDAEYRMQINYFKTQSATVSQSTNNSVSITIGIGPSNNNVLSALDQNNNNSCDTTLSPPTIQGIVNVSSEGRTDKRIIFRHEDNGGIGRTVCNRLTVVTFRVLLLNGRDSIVGIDSANNPDFTYNFLTG